MLRLPRRVALAGGTKLNSCRQSSDLEAVDLQELGLDAIAVDGAGRVRVGATATLDELRRCAQLPEKLRELARCEQPSTLRTLATVGGLIAEAEPESLLLAALLAHDATVEIASGASGAGAAPVDGAATPEVSLSKCALEEVLAGGVGAAALIIAVEIDPAGAVAFERTGRTPADVPIVAAYARLVGASASLALSGVAARPVLVDPADPIAGLDPAGDFRGGGAYRLDLARILARRVLAEVAR